MPRLLALVALLLATPAAAQPAWSPDRPLRLVVSYVPGVGPNIVGRLMAQGLSRRLGQPVVVENRPGAGGTLGADAVAKAAPDGYTLGAIPAAPIALAPFLMARLPYAPQPDLTPLGEFAAFASGVLVHPSVPAANLPELRDWLRAQGGRATCSGSTIGSLLHITMAVVLREWGVDCPLIHYVQPSLPDLLAGRTVMGVDNVSVIQGAVRGGQLRMLAVTAPHRLPAFPDVPALAESMPGFEALSWIALFGPAGLPEPVAARLERELRAVAAEPETVQRLEGMGGFVLNGGRVALAERLARETGRWGRVIRENNIRVE